MANTYLTRTFSTPTSSKIFTFSFWVKKSQGSQSDDIHIFNNYVSGTSRLTCAIDGNENFKIENNNGSYNLRFITDAEYRDINGFYHFVISVDTTQATESNRVKIYVNGVQETSFSTATYPSQNDDIKVPDASHTMYIGTFTGSAQFWDGIMTHVHFIDGTAYDASAFGEFDANGVWKIKTSPSVTYGTNGFFILKNGNSVTDQSGNGNNFTVASGTLTNTEDNPSNVFATGNSLISGTDFLSNGNNTATSSSGLWRTAYSTLAVSSGKYYFETQSSGTSGVFSMVGIIDINQAVKDIYVGSVSRGWGYENDGKIYNNSSQIATYNTYSNSDTIGIAVDLDNNYLYFSKNGVWENSGDPTSGATGTGGISITSGYDYCLVFGAYSANNVKTNFGNGYFGTTAVASAGTNASGIGIFEYDVPTGYTALSTKGLNL
jgi:hypothetical protein